MRALLVLASLVVVPLAGATGPQPGPGRDFSVVSNFAPAWSPDGQELAFAGYAARHAQIYVVDVAGTRVRRITHDSASDFAPRWLRDGRIAFSGQQGGRDFAAVVDARGRGRRPLPFPGDFDFSPDGTKVVYERRDAESPQHQLWVANADGSEARMIVRDGGHDGAQPDWSPDGKRIAFVGGANTDFATIEVVDADGGRRVQVTHGGAEYTPDWSPDGTRIVYAVGSASPFHRLVVVNADGSGARDLGAGSNDFSPAWSPDGRRIAFTSSRSGRDEIWVMDASGANRRRVTYGGCTHIGTVDADVLAGTAGHDVLCGFAGADVLRGLRGADRVVGGTGNDRLDGGAGNDVVLGEAGADVLVAGPGRDRVDGGAGVDTAYADGSDSLRSVERAHGGRRAHVVVPPTTGRIVAATRAAVAASRARPYALRVEPPKLFLVTVEVRDPAAYLRHRANTAIRGIRRAVRNVRFREFDFAVRGPSGLVFSYTEERLDRGTRSTWYVRPDLADCADGIALEAEIDPDGVAPPCPAP